MVTDSPAQAKDKNKSNQSHKKSAKSGKSKLNDIFCGR